MSALLPRLLLPLLCIGAFAAAEAHAIEAATGEIGAYRYDPRYRLARPDDTRPYAREIAAAARQASLDPELVHALIAVESGYRAAAVSPKGAVGLMQVLPETAEAHGVRNALDLRGNLTAGTRHLGVLLAHFDNRLDLALAAYNAGEAAVRQHGNAIPPYPETRHYVPAVLAKYRAARPGAGATASRLTSHNYLAGTRVESKVLQQYR